MVLIFFGLIGAGCVLSVRADAIFGIVNVTSDYGEVNVILMIGDGMGFNHLKCLEAYTGKQPFMYSASVKGEVQTYSLSYPLVTDSAAAATAMATGKKVNNGEIARHQNKDLETCAEFAVRHGLATGIISTESMFGATPASFSSHAGNRGDDDDIFTSQLRSGINLFAGEHKSYYDDKSNAFETNGYARMSSLEFAGHDKIFATYPTIPARVKDETDTTPLLSTLSENAIAFLDSYNEKGFFLMIEEAHIDKRSHSNNMSSMLAHAEAYDRAVEAVVSAAKSLKNTLVIVTADHETGGLSYNGESAAELSDKKFSRGGHSNAHVPYFIFGDDKMLPQTIDNTDVHAVIMDVLDNNL